MISRSRSAPTAAAMSIECTTSANSTLTCLYSAGSAAAETAVPPSSQNFALPRSSVPHVTHTTAATVMLSTANPGCVRTRCSKNRVAYQQRRALLGEREAHYQTVVGVVPFSGDAVDEGQLLRQLFAGDFGVVVGHS